jgi:hypothetical protein
MHGGRHARRNTITVSGTCRALLVFSRRVEVTIGYDAASDRYDGIYVGSRIGPARLSGERNGDTLDLVLTWPRIVNGDRTARMTIRNAGDGRLGIVVVDRPGGAGEPVETTNLTFRRAIRLPRRWRPARRCAYNRTQFAPGPPHRAALMQPRRAGE